MAVMNKTQRQHLLKLLQKKKDAALRPLEDAMYENDKEQDLPEEWTITEFLNQVKAGKVIARPGSEKKLLSMYGWEDEMILVTNLKKYEVRKALVARRAALEKMLSDEIEDIESQLIFQEVSGVEMILSNFDRVIREALTSHK